MATYQYIKRSNPFNEKHGRTLPVFAVTSKILEAGAIDPVALDWARKSGYKAEVGSILPVPAEDGSLGGALFGLGDNPDINPFLTGQLARGLPDGDWHVEIAPFSADQIALGFALGAYRFEEYKKAKRSLGATLAIPKDGVAADLRRQVAATYLVRDLINMPANEMRPKQIEDVAVDMASHYGADVHVITGDELLEQNFPLIHAVGRASSSSPRLIEMRWGHKGAPKITLVGKGVSFDTGGLNIKPGSSMALMKKDMGGAANILGLALMIMDVNLRVDMRVIIPAVENSISGNAFRPGDIYKSRKGLTVQIDNTDAEGRLILADALAYADEEKSDLLIDIATLTGAARVALGPDLTPFFTDNERTAKRIADSAAETNDPMWRLPLYMPYDGDLSTHTADLTNAPGGGMAGSITAALFLKRFVSNTKNWVHCDIYGWNQKDKPHGPLGGEAQSIRALYHYIRKYLKK